MITLWIVAVNQGAGQRRKPGASPYQGAASTDLSSCAVVTGAWQVKLRQT
jgi:hypothetical protein